MSKDYPTHVHISGASLSIEWHTTKAEGLPYFSNFHKWKDTITSDGENLSPQLFSGEKGMRSHYLKLNTHLQRVVKDVWFWIEITVVMVVICVRQVYLSVTTIVRSPDQALISSN